MAQQQKPGEQPPTFKSNVNRAKTKKWIEAKSYTYDGDDWGDVDDYDEYGGYEEEPPTQPPLAPRNTGLRQRGQSASQPAEQGGPSVQQSPYGELGRSQPQQSQAEQRSFTQTAQSSAVQRQNSFDPDQERRAFSSGPPPPSGQNPASGPYSNPAPQNRPAGQDFQSSQTRLNQTGPPYNAPPPNIAPRQGVDDRNKYVGQPPGPQGPYRGPPSPQRSLQPNTETRESSMASNNSSLDFHNRRDFSPSAMPHPLQPRAGGSPSPNSGGGSGGGRPPRTSSLTQDNAPQLPFPTQTPATAPTADIGGVQQSQRDRASSSQSNKGLPFVRPADIYRRMEEEKERARRSQESSRPSMETITPRSRQDSDAVGRPRQMSNLNPVHERKQSELAQEAMGGNFGSGSGIQPQSQPTEKIPTTSKRFDMKKPAGSTSPSGAPSLGPILPDVGRISSFGDSFGESFMGSSSSLGDFSSPSKPKVEPTRESGPTKTQQQQPAASTAQSKGTDLQHQPSLGFTSAVHRSFDAAQDDIPPTPSSVANSTIERSTSGGTSVVSPIMSRGPSAANEPWSNTLPAIDDVASPSQSHQNLQAVDQRPSPGFRRPSPNQPATEQILDPQPSPPFASGHRRNMSTPSPDNSPARTPALDAVRHLRTPQEVELADTTPTPTESEVSADDHIIRGRRPTDQYPTPDQLALSEGRSRTTAEQIQGLQKSAPTDLSSVPPPNIARERPDSAGSPKIRDIAEKFGGSGSRPQSSHSNTTPRASVIPPNAQGNEDLVPPRPINERMDSFRPHLPGGWESSASIAPAAAGSGSFPTTPKANHPDSQSMVPNQREEAPTATQQIKDVSQDAFAAAATAGGALAASLAAVAGIKYKEGHEDSEEEWEKFSDGEVESARDRGASVNTLVPKPPLDPRVDKERSAAPTPLSKDTPRNLQKEPAGSDYFQGPTSSDSAAAADHSDERLHKVSHQLPPLSTDLQSQRPEYESDRLRREIVKELDAGTAKEPSTADSTSPYPTSSKYSAQSAGASSSLHSGIPPRTYWNDERGETDAGDPFIGKTNQSQTSNYAQPSQKATTITDDAPVPGSAAPRAPNAPLDKSNQPQMGSLESSKSSVEQPQTLAHRFSWEGPLQELSPQPAPEAVTPATAFTSPASGQHLPTSDFLKSNVYPDGRSAEPQVTEEIKALKRRSDQSSTVAETSTIGLSNSMRSRDGHREIAVDSHDTDIAIDQANTQAIEEVANDKKLPSYPDNGPELANISSEKQFLKSSPIDPGPEVQNTPSPTAYEKPSQPPPMDMHTPTTIRTVDAPLPPTPSSGQPNMPTFRSLLALKTPGERIRAYDTTREQFANLNTGLAHWLFVTTSEMPEHSDLLSNHGRVLRPAPGQKTSPSPGASGFPSSSNQPTYAPGFSPAGGGGKISGKEVQAKSKELLHSAGVFGGKGIVAGKGLFSKGKNKLRGASGTDKALKSATSTSSPASDLRKQQEALKSSPVATQARKSSRSVPLPDQVAAESQPHHPSEGAESDRNTPSEQSYSKGQMGDDERSSDDYQSAESGPEETGQLAPRSSSLFIGDKHGISRQSLPRSLATSSEAARGQAHQTTNAGFRNETQSPRSTNSSNKTPTQLSFDHSKAMPTPHEKTESPQRIRGIANLDNRSQFPMDTQSQQSAPQHFGYTHPQSEASARPAQTLMGGPSAYGTEQPMQNQWESRDDRSANKPSQIRTTDLTLALPAFSPLMGESDPGFSLSPDFGRTSHTRGISFGSVPSAIDPERPPSPVSPFVPPKDEPSDEQRGRTAAPRHHGIQHDFIEESSVERARRRSNSFSRPFQTGRTSEDSRPFTRPDRPDLQDHPAFRGDRDSGEVALSPATYNSTRVSGERSLASREQAPEYEASGQGAPDLPPVESQSRSRRGSRSSAYFKAIRDSISPSRRSRTREESQQREKSQQPPFADSPGAAANSPQSAFRSSNPLETEEKPRRSSIFGRLKTNNSSHSDQAQKREHSAARASTMPLQTQNVTNISADQGQIERDSPASAKVNAVSRLGQKLQRSSTSANQVKAEPEIGQKKRFSSIGSLFGRNPKRQSSDQYSSQPQTQFQQYGKYTGRPNRPAQRFALDEEEPDEATPSSAHQSPFRGDPSPSSAQPAPPPSQPPAQSPQRELPAYMQDRMLRSPSQQTPSPSPQNPQAPSVNRSSSSWARFSQSGRSNRHSQQQPPPTTSSPHNQTPPPRTKDFVSAPPLSYGSQPTQRSWMEGTTPPPRTFPNPYPPPSQQQQQQSSTPHPPSRTAPDDNDGPPPPPPPKDERWMKTPPHTNTSSGRHTRTGSIPLALPHSNSHSHSRSPAAANRQSLPPLQTNVQKSHHPTAPAAQQPRQQQPYRPPTTTPTSSAPLRQPPPPNNESTAKSPAAAMTPEEKRKSRQDEIERGHLTPTSASASTPVPTSAQRSGGGKMQVVKEDDAAAEGGKENVKMGAGEGKGEGTGGGKGRGVDENEDEPIVMSATSFPADMWQPEFGGWEGE